MIDFRTAILPALDVIRGIPGILGQRRFKVSIRVRTWTGSRPGVDASTSGDSDRTILTDAGTYNPRVRQVSQKDVIASGGEYSDQDLRIGPITPPYTGGDANNSAVTVFDPPANGSPVEIFFLIEGPEMPAGGAWFKKIAQDVTSPLHFDFTVRRTGEVP